MTSTTEAIDWIIRGIVALGIPGLVTKFVYERKRKTKGESKLDNVTATIAERTLGDKIHASSVTSLESQIAATERAWAMERETKDRTIEFQERQIASLQGYVESRDKLIVELRAQVDNLQAELFDIIDKLDALQRGASAKPPEVIQP